MPRPLSTRPPRRFRHRLPMPRRQVQLAAGVPVVAAVAAAAEAVGAALVVKSQCLSTAWNLARSTTAWWCVLVLFQKLLTT